LVKDLTNIIPARFGSNLHSNFRGDIQNKKSLETVRRRMPSDGKSSPDPKLKINEWLSKLNLHLVFLLEIVSKISQLLLENNLFCHICSVSKII
jgi:hypothetical protein